MSKDIINLHKELYRRMIFSRKVFCGATRPLRPPGILTSRLVLSQGIHSPATTQKITPQRDPATVGALSQSADTTRSQGKNDGKTTHRLSQYVRILIGSVLRSPFVLIDHNLASLGKHHLPRQTWRDV